MDKEIRAFNFELRAEDDEQRGKVITGRPIVYGSRTNLGDIDEIIDEGALDATDLKDVRLLVNHNTDMLPLARSRNNTENSTMQLTVDPEGMTIRANLDTENNADAKSLYSAVSRGDVSGMSFMFTVDKDSWEDVNTDHPVRHVRSISRVFEVSAVTWPAYSATSIQARGLADALESAKASLESERRRLAELEQKKTEIREILGVL